MFKKNMIFFTAVFIGIGSNAFSGGYPNNSSDSSSSNLSSTQQNSSNLNAVNSSNMNYSNNNSTNNQQNVANNQQTQTFQRSSSSRGQSDQGFDAVENDELIMYQNLFLGRLRKFHEMKNLYWLNKKYNI